jgi:hypothetical protein
VDGGLIYSSTNAGGAWTATTAPNRQWQSVASSGDGTRLVGAYAQGFLDGGIYISSNSGNDWTLATTPSTGWYSVASSADGTKLAAMTTDLLTPAGPFGWIYTSADAGVLADTVGTVDIHCNSLRPRNLADCLNRSHRKKQIPVDTVDTVDTVDRGCHVGSPCIAHGDGEEKVRIGRWTLFQ